VAGKLQPTDLLIGQKVRMARIEKGLTQVDLAEALGVTFQQVQKYEAGKNRIAVSRLIDIARVLQTTIAALLPTREAPPPQAPALSKQSAQLLRDFESIADVKLRESVLSVVRKLSAASMVRASQLTPPLRTHSKRRA
jgi:transcriptional regulator with XRE-family HTH domain